VSNFSERVSFIWSVADLLRGPYKPAQYGKVILPLTVLRRLDCVLEPTKQKVLDKAAALKASGIKDIEPILNNLRVPSSGLPGCTRSGNLHGQA
jgi:type I restriction enzyme M protein